MDNKKKCVTCYLSKKDCICCKHYHYIENSILFYCDRNNNIYICDDYYDFPDFILYNSNE